MDKLESLELKENTDIATDIQIYQKSNETVKINRILLSSDGKIYRKDKVGQTDDEVALYVKEGKEKIASCRSEWEGLDANKSEHFVPELSHRINVQSDSTHTKTLLSKGRDFWIQAGFRVNVHRIELHGCKPMKAYLGETERSVTYSLLKGPNLI